MKVEQLENLKLALVSIYDSLALRDNDQNDNPEETLTELYFRKLRAYNIDLNEFTGLSHLKPVKKEII